MAPEPRAQSIATVIFTLVVGAFLAATMVHLVLTFRGPPPWPAPVPLRMVTDAIQGRATHGPGRHVRVEVRDALPEPGKGEHFTSALSARVAAMTGRHAGDVVAYAVEEPRGPGGPGDFLRGDFTIGVRRGSGWVVVRNPAPQIFTAWHAALLTSMLVALLVLLVPAWWIARALSRPLVRLARAAREMRLGVPSALPTDGPREVRALAGALNTMQRRLAAQAQGRTTMLAAIAHDMGTPLTRLAFWVEQLPEDARERAAADITEMRALLQQVLRLGREESVALSRVRVDLGSLIETLGDDLAAAGQPVTIVGGPRVVVRGDKAALRRMFANLIDNAVRYGNAACVGWSVVGDHVDILIDDEGPGFGPGDRTHLFEPFVRGDPSRNRDTGGTGLGLAVVRAVAEAHGGAVTLEESRDGHGRVRVRLMLSSGETG